MADNIITALLRPGGVTTTKALWQYDYGRFLKLTGHELPPAYEVHFANAGDSISKTQIGNADGVRIPDEYLETGKEIYAWLFLHVGPDDGETEAMVIMPVKSKSKPGDEPPTPVEQSAVTQAIAALNEGVQRAEAAADGIEQTVVDALTEAKESGEFDGDPGKDGISPEISATAITGGHRITITDATGTKTIDVLDGTNGDNGVGISSIAKTGTSGMLDTYTITYTNGQTTSFTVTNGQDGDNGYSPTASVSKSGNTATITITDKTGTTSAQVSDGMPGVSPSITVTDITGGHRITITDAEGEHSFDVMDGDAADAPVQDVQVNGTSVVTDGVANVPIAGTNLGVVKIDGTYGVTSNSSGRIYIAAATDNVIKNGSSSFAPIVPVRQHTATFYGLAKAAGDTTQSGSSNAVGNYTDAAKSAILSMLGVSGIIGNAEGATASKAYAVGDAFLHAGALYKATSAIAASDAIVPGTNCEQTTILNLLKGV